MILGLRQKKMVIFTDDHFFDLAIPRTFPKLLTICEYLTFTYPISFITKTQFLICDSECWKNGLITRLFKLSTHLPVFFNPLNISEFSD